MVWQVTDLLRMYPNGSSVHLVVQGLQWANREGYGERTKQAGDVVGWDENDTQ